ncbi:MAG: hypothetical protein IPI01_21545, partial [Ignavibacteriae bacterium]|nr:hypothetical protein [Ignavibacteriota bacterium]
VNAHSKNLDAAWEFIKYLRSEEADMDWVRLDMGGMAVTNAALASPEAQKVEDLSMFIRELKHARPFPPHPKVIAVAGNTFTPFCQKAIVGDMTPQAALDQAALEAQRTIEGKE